MRDDKGLVTWFRGLKNSNKISFGTLVIGALGLLLNAIAPAQNNSTAMAENVFDELCKKDKELCTVRQGMQSKNEEIQALKDIIEDLRKPRATDEEQNFATKAEIELSRGNTNLAKAFYAEEAKKNIEAGNASYLRAAESLRRKGALDFLNDPEKAMVAYKESVELDPSNVLAWNRLGVLCHSLGRIEDAVNAYTEVLQLSKNNTKMTAIAYTNLGIVRRSQGDLRGADDLYKKALVIYEDLGDKKGIGSVYLNLGNICLSQNNFVTAENYYNRALATYTELDSPDGLMAVYGNLGVIYYNRKDLEKAKSYFTKTLEISKKIEDRKSIAHCYSDLGLVCQDQNQFASAEDYYKKALAIHESIGHKEGIGADYLNLGFLCQVQGDFASAEKFYNKALVFFEDIAGIEYIADLYKNYGKLRKMQKDYTGAEYYWQRSLALYKQIGAAPMIEKVQGWLDKLEDNKDS